MEAKLPTDAEPVVVIEGDCLEVLKALPDGCVDAIVTDPPYGVGFKYNSHDDSPMNYGEWCCTWFQELRRVCSGPILITCGVANLGMWHVFEKPKWVLCWHKPASMGRCAVGFNNWEPVLNYGTALKSACDVFQAVIKPDKGLDGHPCPKPLQWGIEQVKRLPATCQLILDPFGGSGTTAIAALHEGRRCLIIEKDPAYCALIRKRVAAATDDGLFAGVAPAQPSLFDSDDAA